MKKATQRMLNRAVALARAPDTRREALAAARRHGREVAGWLRLWAKSLPTGSSPALMEARDIAQRVLRIDADLARKRGRNDAFRALPKTKPSRVLKRKLWITYTPPAGDGPLVEWDTVPPASMLIGNGGMAGIGDFAIEFGGTDTGKPFPGDERPLWRVLWKTAVGTTHPATSYREIKRFDRYRDAVQYAKAEENKRLDLLGGRK